MTPEDWQRAKDILFQAWELEDVERNAFLDRACSTDADLRRRVEAVLASDESGGEYLSEPLPGLAGAVAVEDESASLAGRRIGPYQLVRELGHGGMGTVYLAERADGQFRKRVAIKLIHPALTNEPMVKRFRHERQVEASLEHPNIARFLDGGATEDGFPYLVMEFVDGVRIDDWCDSRDLSVRDRLKLFRELCAAVQHAHDNQVIHRDIKPSNVLVGADARPKLLDFGIAKVLNPELATGTQELTIGPGLMTPEYASPEQVRGEPIGVASDVYSLGVLLYRLLTGQLPYAIRGGDLGQIARTICEQAPAKPSAICQRREFAGALDDIVLKALRKEPDSRYGSVQEFSDDIDRYLTDLPVHARKDKLAYHGRKFVKRHRAIIAAAASVIVILVLAAALGRMNAPNKSTAAAVSRHDPRWDHLKFEKIAALGDAAPGGGVYSRYFQPWGLNNHGDLVFASQVQPDREAFFLFPKGAAPVTLARPGQPAPGGRTFDGAVAGYASLNDAGDVALAVGLKALNPAEPLAQGKRGLYFYSHTQQRVNGMLVPGITPVPGFGIFQHVSQRPILNNWGDIVFPGFLLPMGGSPHQGGSAVMLLHVDGAGAITKVAAPGDPAPGGSAFDYTFNPFINDPGDIVFEGHLMSGKCIADAPECAGNIYLKTAAMKSIEAIAADSEQASQSYHWGAVANNTRAILFIGQYPPPHAFGQTRALYLFSQGVSNPIAKPGDVMPDGRKIVNLNPPGVTGNYALNNRLDVSFTAALEKGESGLYVRSAGETHLIAGTGSVLPGIGKVASVHNFNLNTGILNDRGQLLFWAKMTDGKFVLLLATPGPEAATLAAKAPVSQAPNSPRDVTFTDDTFNDSDWRSTVFTFGDGAGGGGGSATAVQSIEGGNPGPFLRIQFVLNYAQPPAAHDGVSAFYYRRGAAYAPSKQGAIASIDSSEDMALLSVVPPLPSFVDLFVGLFQNGAYYWAGGRGTQTLAWTRASAQNLTAADFVGINSLTGEPQSELTVHPDFSSTGSHIQFGFWRRHRYNNGGAGATVIAGVDNWSLTVHPVPRR